MGILDKKIQYFPGKIYKCTPLGELTLRQFIEAHKNPKPEIKSVFNQIAEAEKKEDWETKGRLKQNNLYYFTPAVWMDGKGRSYEHIESFQNIMVFDFDHIGMDANEFRDRLFEKYKSIICAYKSPSGNGVKALVRIPKVNSVEEYKEYAYGACYVMEGVKSFDTCLVNSVLPLFLSWDEGIRWREDPEEWTLRGGKYNEFEEFNGDIEEVEDVSDDDKKEVLRRAKNIVDKADEENVGHLNVRSAALLAGGYCATNYIDIEEMEQYLFNWIDESPYLSTKANTYKKTAQTMIKSGTKAPLYLKKHNHLTPEQNKKELKKHKRSRKYFLLCNKMVFDINRLKN